MALREVVMAGKRSWRRALQAAVTALSLVTGPMLLSTVASARPLPDVPASSSTCNGSVCEYVQGSGTQVTDWETTAYAGSATCTYANFWVDYVLERQSAQQCVAAGTQLRSDWKNTSFPAGTVLCNTWANIAGQPCVTIGG
jgi:hypothetical protein